MTHGELIKLAERWVRRCKRRYPVVLTDVRMMVCSEQPDVFAFGVNGSLLVECKASRADFLADASKPFRRDGSRGLGEHRYYCAPKDMLKREDLPAGWGLLEVGVRGAVVETVRASGLPMESDAQAERVIIVAACQRAIQGWGRRMFGDDAPATMIDGDAHPSATKIIREQRAQIKRLEQELGALRRAESEAETKVETYG